MCEQECCHQHTVRSYPIKIRSPLYSLVWYPWVGYVPDKCVIRLLSGALPRSSITSISGGWLDPHPMKPLHGVFTSQLAGQFHLPDGDWVSHSTACPTRTYDAVTIAPS